MNEILRSALPIAIIVSVPSLMAIIGILFNKRDVSALEGKMDARFTASDAKIDRLGDKMDRLTEAVKQGILALNIKVADNNTRISLLEEKMKTLAEAPPRRAFR